MYRIITIILIIICNWSLSQEHSSLFQSKTIKQNRVYKVLEYNPKDSINYFQKYPSGYYSKYDRRGRMTEENHYSPYENDGVWYPNMFTNYYLYDSLDNQISFAQIHHEMETPLAMLYVSSYNESDTIKVARIKDLFQENSEILFEEIKKQKSQFWGDTIKISKNHFFMENLNDSTTTMDFYFNNKGVLDSTIFKSPSTGWSGKHISENITKYDYYENGEVRFMSKKNYKIQDSRELSSITEYYFLENGLFEKLRSYYSLHKEWNVRKFKYFYRTD